MEPPIFSLSKIQKPAVLPEALSTPSPDKPRCSQTEPPEHSPTLTDTTRFNPAVVEPLTAALSHLTNATLELKTVTDALTQQINTENNNQEQPNASERGKE